MPLGGIGDIATGTLEQIIGFGVGGVLENVLAPEATQLAQESWRHSPILAVDPPTAALMARLGFVTEDWAASEAAMYGVSGERFSRMVRSTRTPPPPSELLELVRREKISRGDLVNNLRQAGIDDRFVEPYTDLLRVHLSAADAAMARQQGFIDAGKAREIAARGGLESEDADLLYEMSGLPPGIGEALTLLRRGKIGNERFAQIVREGHTKTKYTDELLELRWQPLTAALAAEALVRERTSRAHAEEIAAQNGLHPDDFKLYVELLGRPMGIGQALTLVRRGEMTDKQFGEVVARSDVKTEYTDFLLKLKTVYPPLFQIMRLVGNGAIDDAFAKEILTKEGYPKKLVDGIVAGAHKNKAATKRHLTVSIIDTLFLAGLETHTEAEKALENLGYSAEDAEDLLQVMQARRIVSEIAHAINVIRTRYTSWKITNLQARAQLNTVDIDANTVDRLLKFWDTEREANQPQLTSAQIASAFHYGRFELDQAIQKLQKLGWTPDDALTLLWTREHGDPHGAKGATPVAAS